MDRTDGGRARFRGEPGGPQDLFFAQSAVDRRAAALAWRAVTTSALGPHTNHIAFLQPAFDCFRGLVFFFFGVWVQH